MLSQRVGGRDAAARVCLGPHPARLWFWRLLDQATWARGPRGARRLPPHAPVPSVSHLQGGRLVYAGSSSGVVQAPVAFCGKHGTCEDCVLARDPYCAWSRVAAACVALPPHQTDGPSRYRGRGTRTAHTRQGEGARA